MATSVLIIDDHPLMRDAVRMTMESIAPGGRVDMAESFSEARRLLASEQEWDYALLDLNLPDCEGFDGLIALRELRPALTTVVLSGDTDRDTILRCIDLGASGYIPKTYPSDVLRHALRLVASGHLYVPREALGRETLGSSTGIGSRTGFGASPVAGGIHSNSSQPSGMGYGGSFAQDVFPPQPHGARESIAGTSRAADPRRLGLTDRQCDVLRLILRGLPNKLICRQLDLAEGTVKVHVSAVLRALGVRNRTQAVIAASRLGLKMSE
jgi:DNA-binding NarL/FixJ family response regulator